MSALVGQDNEIGFSRPEMFSKTLAGTWKERTDRCIFLILGKADDWPSDVADLPADSLLHVLKAAVKGAAVKYKTKIMLAEAAAGDTEGDVLVFPGPTRVNIKSGTTALVRVLQSPDETPLVDRRGSGGDMEDCHVFVCAHKQRDARCGHCGPALTLQAISSGAASSVRKCSHVGGHEYAGNAMVFRGSDGDFYGYLDPEKLPDAISGKARHGPLWRGGLGLSKEEVQQIVSRKKWEKLAPVLEVVVWAGAGIAIAYLVHKLSKRNQ